MSVQFRISELRGFSGQSGLLTVTGAVPCVGECFKIRRAHPLVTSLAWPGLASPAHHHLTEMLPTGSPHEYPSTPPPSFFSPFYQRALGDVLLPMGSTKHTQPSTRLAVMLSIFFVSLFGLSPLPYWRFFPSNLTVVYLIAVSFPAISKRVRNLHIPPIVFFVGRHFGTGQLDAYIQIVILTLSKGVILSTAFVHLLQDAFDRLQDPQVKEYTDIGRWTGLIV